MEYTQPKKRNLCQRKVIAITVAFIIIVLGIVAGMDIKNTMELQNILEESVKSQLISISIAAREMINVDAFDRYNSVKDTAQDSAAYEQTLTQLRQLATNVGASYIYALKMIDGVPMFVFDTDVENPEIFISYELSPVHEAAFAGKESADVMNVEDLYGTFNTSAVPIWKDGRVIGIISTDIEDVYLQQSRKAATTNAIILLIVMVIAMGVLLAFVIVLLKRVERMQSHLAHLAHHDTITGLPNRQYLLEFLGNVTSPKNKKQTPFALFFIDLDNFKQVNDRAGHEAGDELLRSIAQYLDSAHEGVKAFRPAAGKLNIAARIGGDEFVQVVSGISTVEEAAKAAERLLEGFKTQVSDRYIEKYGVGLSIGVALYPYHTTNYHVLIQYADVAMYYAKRAGKNTYRVYEDEMAHTDVNA